ncbi:hypothetical protein BTI66_02935 [Lactobacillus delbrueckii subsp. bulgaricus]|nr:hypothetical protein [Lactobacillus delbrueckii subsp. bulgaricus]
MLSQGKFVLAFLHLLTEFLPTGFYHLEGRQRIQKADRGRRKLEQTQKADQVARLDPLFR